MLARLVLCSVVVLALGAARAEAQTLTVTNSSDADPGSLRALVAGAGDGDTIVVPPSISNPIVLTSGPIVIKKSITIAGSGAGTTVVDGNHASRIFDVSDDGVTHPAVTISDLTIQHGLGDGLGGGGARVNELDTLHLVRDRIVDNQAMFGLGGGVADLGGVLTIDHSTVSGNSSGTDGGGVAAFVAGMDDVSVTVTTISDSTVSGNTAPAGRSGGGVTNNANMTIERSTISGNTAGRSGAGVDTASAGGQGGPLTLVDSTVTGNNVTSPGFEGGAVHIQASPGAPVLLLNDTIAGNSGAPGDGVHVDSSVGGIANDSGGTMLFNTIVAGNSGPLGKENCDQFNQFAGDHNLEDRDTCGLHGPGDLVNTDPLLTQLTDNGGPTLTRQPIPNSPAIGAADATRCPPVDQRGVPYFAPNPCDIGAVDTARPGPPGVPGTSPPAGAAISRLAIRPSTFAAAGHGSSVARKRKRRHVGATVSYRQLLTGSTSFVVRARRRGVRSRAGRCLLRTGRKVHGRRCTLFIKVGGFSRTGRAGANRFHFSGRVRHHKLRPGRYRLDATATAAGKKRTLRKSFRIIR